ASEKHLDLAELPIEVLQSFHPGIADDVYQVLSLHGSMHARNVLGGTAPDQVRQQIARNRVRLGA
ncbi:MAG: argininosuccinate lyase, partial [Limnohabitans sp.]